MAGIQLERDTKWLLEQWAIWAKQNCEISHLNYPRIQPYTRLVTKSTTSHYLITDDIALQVDSLLRKLIMKDERMGKATTLFYFFGNNASQVGRKLNTNRKVVSTLVSNGTAWVDGALTVG